MARDNASCTRKVAEKMRKGVSQSYYQKRLSSIRGTSNPSVTAPQTSKEHVSTELPSFPTKTGFLHRFLPLLLIDY